MLGYGLGGFMDGFARGYGLKMDWEDREQAREDRAVARERADARWEWETQDRAFTQGERQRARDQRDAIDQINADVRSEFEASGAPPDQFDDFWKKYALPKLQNELLLQGDIQGAKDLMEWGESEAALEGGRLFASALFKSQTGDHDGALDDVIRAGKLRGYIAGDFDIGDKEPILDDAGELIGYRLTITTGDGNVLEQDIAIDDIPTVIATFANPTAAWESQVAAKAAEAERETEFEDFERRERLKDDLSDDDDQEQLRSDAIESLRERMPANDPMYEGTPFDALPNDEKEQLIGQEIDLITGKVTPQPPPRQMIVDTESGQPVRPQPSRPTPDPGALSNIPGLGTVPRPAQGAAKAGTIIGGMAPGLGSTPAPRPAPVINGKSDASLAVPTHAELVDHAARLMVEGGNPQEIARMLSASGVEQQQWPAGLVRVLGSTNGPR